MKWLVYAAGRAPVSFSILRADGSVVLRRDLGYFFDSSFSFSLRKDNLFVLFLNTGYLLQPRAYIGFDLDTGKTVFNYPTALLSGSAGLLVKDGIFYASAFSSSNGAELMRQDGFVERDTELYLNVFDMAGNKLPGSLPLPEAEAAGFLNPFMYEGGGGGGIYLIHGKTEGYYEGVPKIYKLTDDGGPQVLHTGPRNSNFGWLPIPVLEGGVVKFVVFWINPYRMDILDGNMNFERTLQVSPEIRFAKFFDLDNNGNSEIYLFRGNKISIQTLWGETLAELTTGGGDSDVLSNFFVSDLDLDGKAEIVIAGRDSLSIYGY